MTDMQPKLYPNTLLLFKSNIPAGGPTHDGRTTFTSHHPKQMASLPIHEVYLLGNKVYENKSNAEMGEIIISDAGVITGHLILNQLQFDLYGSFKKNKSGSLYIMCSITAPAEWYEQHPKAIYQGKTKDLPTPQLTTLNDKNNENIIRAGKVGDTEVVITNANLQASEESGTSDMTIKQSDDMAATNQIARQMFKVKV